MKNARIIAIALIGLGLAMASSCTKEHRTDGNAPVFKAGVERSAKTAFSEADNLVWTEGDQVAIFGATATAATYHPENINGDKCDLVASEGNPGDGPYTAIYPVTIATGSNTVTLPRVQASTSGELTGYPMYAESNSTVLSFKNLCSILKITMQKEGTSIKKIQLITDQFMNGDFTIDYNGGEPTLEHSTNTTNNTKVATLELASAVDISNGHNFYIYLPAGTYNYFQIRVYDNAGNSFTRTTTSGLTFNRSEYNYLTIPESAINFVPGVLSGKFSVSSTTTVSFSKGNLLQSGSTYYFAEEQYNKQENGYTYLFQWATNASSTTYLNPGGGTTTIANGGSGWRTLTNTEWGYLLSGRGHTYEYLFNIATVNSVRGVIIYPDNFAWPLDIAIPDPTSPRHTYDTPITLDNWRILEAAGCVFLPVTGQRYNGASSISSTTYGYYWSSTHSTRYEEKAYIMEVQPDNIQFPGGSYGESNPVISYNAVRLVK